MKLYYSPGACSIGIHVLLEEIGKPYETELRSTRDGSLQQPDFVAKNPKSKVPTLERDDGSVLTEYPAIAWWLASTHPEAKLLPGSVEGQTRAIEATDYCVATMHMQGFARIFRPGNFAPDEAQHDAVKARGREIFTKGLTLLDRQLDGREYIAGDYSFADTAVFYVSFWWSERVKEALPGNVAAHYGRMRARPAVQRTMAAEGLA
jgi:glutathione S-transferase